MMTSNRSLEDWGKLVGDVPSATPIFDCCLHHADVITITVINVRSGNMGFIGTLIVNFLMV
ncbi:MAG: hypothetical protein HYR83_15625 [Planctomycetes bacterium]|nr:hypothetical protein [Planctomycetota bacterium]